MFQLLVLLLLWLILSVNNRAGVDTAGADGGHQQLRSGCHQALHCS